DGLQLPLAVPSPPSLHTIGAYRCTTLLDHGPEPEILLQHHAGPLPALLRQHLLQLRVRLPGHVFARHHSLDSRREGTDLLKRRRSQIRGRTMVGGHSEGSFTLGFALAG